MFKRKKKAVNPNATDTLIGEGTVFDGHIESEAGIRVEGEITGDMNCKGDVTIGEGGVAKSNISARNVVIAGTVKGNVIAKGTLTIHASGTLEGDAAAASLVISEGGKFLGTSRMAGALEAADAEAAAAQVSASDADAGASAGAGAAAGVNGSTAQGAGANNNTNNANNNTGFNAPFAL